MKSSEHSYSSPAQNIDNPGCVVVIDDNPDVRQLLACTLDMAGFDVLEAGTEIELQRLLGRNRPDALIIDLQRSPAQALRLLARMRRRQTLRDVAMVFLAGTDAEDFRAQALRTGADWFALRPLSMIDLQNRVAQLVQRQRRRAEGARRQRRVS
jgi:two-component system OmpR family response regulator